jgi:hypothetical protein
MDIFSVFQRRESLLLILWLLIILITFVMLTAAFIGGISNQRIIAWIKNQSIEQGVKTGTGTGTDTGVFA